MNKFNNLIQEISNHTHNISVLLNNISLYEQNKNCQLFTYKMTVDDGTAPNPSISSYLLGGKKIRKRKYSKKFM